MSEQFGFTFEVEPAKYRPAKDCDPNLDDSGMAITEPEEEIYDPPGVESPLQTFLIPELEEEAKQREESKEPEIPWAEYTRMVQLFFNEAQHEEFRELTSKLAVLYGTKSVTDTVAEAMRNATLRSKV